MGCEGWDLIVVGADRVAASALRSLSDGLSDSNVLSGSCGCAQ